MLNEAGGEMRLLMATGHEEMLRFVARDPRIDVCDVAETAEELLAVLRDTKADVIVLSRNLGGNENPKQLLESIRSLRRDIRIIFLYGKEDKDTKEFLVFLERQKINDYFVGTDISSEELIQLIFPESPDMHRRTRPIFGKRTKTLRVKEIDSAVIAIYSNSSNGKSHFAWNMAVALTQRGYRTTLINIDRGFSANIYFGIEEIYHDLLDYLTANQNHKAIMDSCCIKGNLHIVSGKPGSDVILQSEDFLKLLYFARAQSDIVIIDTYTGLNETTLQAINNSSVDFLLFDSDLMHFHMNKIMLKEQSNWFMEKKTFAVINNCNTGSEAYKYIYKQLSKLGIHFKGIFPLSSCGTQGCDLMCTGKTPYQASPKSSFSMDLDKILAAIHARSAR